MKLHETRHLRVAAVLAFVGLAAGCASGPTVITNAAPGFSLVDYQTFSFLRPLSTDNGNVRTILSNELIDVTQRELEIAGLRHVEMGGDLLVNFVVARRETLQTRTSPSASVHHGRGRYGTWTGYGMHTSSTEIVQRTEGTLGIDVIDASELQLVWEGTATKRITEQMQQNRAEVVDEVVRAILAEFP